MGIVNDKYIITLLLGMIITCFNLFNGIKRKKDIKERIYKNYYLIIKKDQENIEQE